MWSNFGEIGSNNICGIELVNESRTYHARPDVEPRKAGRPGRLQVPNTMGTQRPDEWMELDDKQADIFSCILYELNSAKVDRSNKSKFDLMYAKFVYIKTITPFIERLDF